MRLCYNTLFQIMQNDNFWNLKRVIFTEWKHLEHWICLWYCFRVIKRYTFHFLMKSVPNPGDQSSFELLHLFDTWQYQSLVVLFCDSVMNLIQILAERDFKWTRLSAIICPYLANFIKHNKSKTMFLHEIFIIFSPFYLSEPTNLISSFNLRTELSKSITDSMIIQLIYRSP